MNEILMIFLSLSLSGSLIALLFYLLKPLFKDRLSKTWQYYVLLIVVLRLLVPFGPETSLVGTIFNQAGIYVDTEDIPAANVSEIDYTPQTLPMETPPKPESNANSLGYLRSTVQMAINLLWLSWLAPALILMLRKIISYHRSVRSVKAGCIKIDNAHVIDVYQEVCRAMKIKHSPILAKNESVAAPMLAGIVRPVIILPDICLKDREMLYVLQHELTHYKRLDIIYKWLVQIVVCLHWYNPLVYRICREINRNCELSCDEAVIMRLDETEKYTYGDMLLDTIKLNKKSRPPVVSLTLNEDTKLIKERLGAIMKYRKKSKVVVFISLISAVFLLCGATFAGAYSAIKPTPTTLDNTTPAISGATSSSPIFQGNQTIVYENVEMLRYEEAGGSHPAHPYIHNIRTNSTSKTIVGYQCGMLAYDKDGQPLKIDWYSLDAKLDNAFYRLYERDVDGTIEILPNETDNVFGGISLNYWGNDPSVDEIAYVLYCDKEITFEDGTVWINPDFDKWLNTYKGKTIDVDVLENYYPYVQNIVF